MADNPVIMPVTHSFPPPDQRHRKLEDRQKPSRDKGSSGKEKRPRKGDDDGAHIDEFV